MAVERATFGLPEIDVGRSGGAAHLRRFTHEGTVRRMMLTGKPLSAKDAQRVGLVDFVVEQSDWPQAVDRLRRELALATAAVSRGAKMLLKKSASQHKMLSTARPGHSSRTYPDSQRRDSGGHRGHRGGPLLRRSPLTAGSGPGSAMRRQKRR